MATQDVLWSARMWVTFPILFYSLYLTRLYTNGFWIEMVGLTQASLSILALSFSILAWISIFPAFESHLEQARTRWYHALIALIIAANTVVLAIVYLGRDSKQFECTNSMDLFLKLNANTFFVSAFNRHYPTLADRMMFVNARTLDVHDAGICVVVISFLLHFVLVGNIEALLESRDDQRMKAKTKGQPLDLEEASSEG
jgi:hypothetical protein